MGERKQKREILHSESATAQNRYFWSYCVLAPTEDQLSMWNCIETSASICGSLGLGSSCVWLMSTEYLIYGIEYPGVREDIPRITSSPVANGGER